MWLADRHSDQELYTAAKHCAKIHLVQLRQTEEFLNLPLCLLLDIIKGINHDLSLCAMTSKTQFSHLLQRSVLSLILLAKRSQLAVIQHIMNETLWALCLCLDGVPSSQNPTVAIEVWINHNKVEREEFSCILQENLKVTFFHRRVLFFLFLLKFYVYSLMCLLYVHRKSVRMSIFT